MCLFLLRQIPVFFKRTPTPGDRVYFFRTDYVMRCFCLDFLRRMVDLMNRNGMTPKMLRIHILWFVSISFT